MRVERRIGDQDRIQPVMPALVAGIHVVRFRKIEDVDGRDKPGHDAWHVQSLLLGLRERLRDPRPGLLVHCGGLVEAGLQRVPGLVAGG
ncbi:hypothetical protein D1920_12270 [Rhodopseudomonas palustris]|nr:hypothetical protein D1920_12270 [Rhodopseudomonas palustris]